MTTDIQSAALLAKRIDTARGMMLGPALGDSWTRPHSPGQLRPAGAATQLTCATVHGLIRSLEHAGRNLPLEFEHTTFTALQRWATAQQIPSTRPSRAPEPWQATTPGYTQRRGSAPATERAHEVPHTTDGRRVLSFSLPEAPVGGSLADFTCRCSGRCPGQLRSLPELERVSTKMPGQRSRQPRNAANRWVRACQDRSSSATWPAAWMTWRNWSTYVRHPEQRARCSSKRRAVSSSSSPSR